MGVHGNNVPIIMASGLVAGQEVEPVVQELTKNDLGRPMPNCASQVCLLVGGDASFFHLTVATRLRMSGHVCVPDGAPIKCSAARLLFPTTHQLSHQDMPFAVSVSGRRAVYG